ncbi:hypothetical protein, partial [Streptomyces sp. NPDC047968]|uniref:hypothetical protein n=2 Tax=unclassified Streptomyces TaxID=2593676 RepID=UPI0034399095
MAQTVCLHCGAAAPPRPDACPCTAAWTGAPEGAEPFAWLRVRPYADAPAPTRHVRVERERGRPVDPAGAGRSFDLLVALHAVVRAGGAYLPL